MAKGSSKKTKSPETEEGQVNRRGGDRSLHRAATQMHYQSGEGSRKKENGGVGGESGGIALREGLHTGAYATGCGRILGNIQPC